MQFKLLMLPQSRKRTDGLHHVPDSNTRQTRLKSVDSTIFQNNLPSSAADWCLRT